MYFKDEQARTQTVAAEQMIRREFGKLVGSQIIDAQFLDAGRRAALGFAGMPFEAPVCSYLLSDPDISAWIGSRRKSLLLIWNESGLKCYTASGLETMPEEAEKAAEEIYQRVIRSPGTLNGNGELILDLKTCPVGPHYPVNLLLGNRAGYPYPLVTTPKSAVDSLGRGSFRATGGEQVLATRCVLQLEENGEPANRQFYLTENGRQIFYSANVRENVASAVCVHSQNRTVITYHTLDGLEIIRTIFILPQQEGMPNAAEAQRVKIINRGNAARKLRIVMTGVFGIAGAMTIANDVVYANIVSESEIFYEGSHPAALTLYSQPKEEHCRKRFATMLCNGALMDEFCTSESDFIGSGTLDHPDMAAHLPCRYSRKMTPFFAMGSSFSLKKGGSAVIDSFTGMMETEGDVRQPFDSALHLLLEKYRRPAALKKTLAEVVQFWKKYPSYIVPKTDDAQFNAYVSHNLPFQVLYQTYVSRAFAWTQKSYRETGFREIQDIYASMYYLNAIGQRKLVRQLLESWVVQVYRMGYANHDFTFIGKEPGDCSDDQLWLVQAVYRYVKLTGDVSFLRREYPIAGEEAKRPLLETLKSILTYSGEISVGRHGLPLLDKADWNDTLRLDPEVMKGPEKEKRYLSQLKEKKQKYGAPLENTLSESVMNACLLRIAADEAGELAGMVNDREAAESAAALAERITASVQANAWKDGYFARCLINDGRPGGYTYLGARGDGLSKDPRIDGSYYLNSYSWPILAGIADEEQIRSMLEIVKKYLKTDAGLKLCTLVEYDRLGVSTGTALYFPGDRENGGVFKHAAMMATVASLKAAKAVKDEQLAEDLADLAFFMISRTVPYAAMQSPFRLKGNPRFCTQYNNSETGENIGPMLSGTASWLTLAVYEFLGIEVSEKEIVFCPVLKPGQKRMAYSLHLGEAEIDVEIRSDGSRIRPGRDTRCLVDGKHADACMRKPAAGRHRVIISL